MSEEPEAKELETSEGTISAQEVVNPLLEGIKTTAESLGLTPEQYIEEANRSLEFVTGQLSTGNLDMTPTGDFVIPKREIKEPVAKSTTLSPPPNPPATDPNLVDKLGEMEKALTLLMQEASDRRLTQSYPDIPKEDLGSLAAVSRATGKPLKTLVEEHKIKQAEMTEKIKAQYAQDLGVTQEELLSKITKAMPKTPESIKNGKVVSFERRDDALTPLEAAGQYMGATT